LLIEAALQAIVPAYLEYYADNSQHESEHIFDVPFSGTRLRGKIDDIVNNTTLLETKFKNRIEEENLAERIPMDWQVNFYALALYLEYKKMPKKLIYDVVRYPSLKGNPKDLYETTKADIAKRPEFWFKRWEMSFIPELILKFKAELQQKITEAINRKIWYKNECSCVAGYGNCNYINVCTKSDTSGLITKELFSELK